MDKERRVVLIDMRADGSFADPPRASLAQRVLRGALVVAFLAAAVALAFLLLGLALILIPVALGAAGLAWGTWRFQRWRAGR